MLFFNHSNNPITTTDPFTSNSKNQNSRRSINSKFERKSLFEASSWRAFIPVEHGQMEKTRLLFPSFTRYRVTTSVLNEFEFTRAGARIVQFLPNGTPFPLRCIILRDSVSLLLQLSPPPSAVHAAVATRLRERREN